jgi:hypothetical protein
LLEGEKYIVRSGAVLNSILDMRSGKHSLHFVVDDKLIPHAIVNITDKKNIHIGVYYFIYLFIYLFFHLFINLFIFIYLLIYLFMYILLFIYFYLFIYLYFIIYLFIYLFINLFIYFIYLFIYLFIYYCLFIYIIYYIQFSSWFNITITLFNISLLSLPPPVPNTRCIAYNFDGSNVNYKDFSMLRYEDGGEILNTNDYLE